MATIRVELINNLKTVRVVDSTNYTSYPNARGILVIQDPNGNYIVNNGDFDNPDITVGSPISAEFPLNLVAGAIPEGIYTVTYNVDYDLDDVSDDTTNLTFTYDASDLVTIAIEVESSLADETIQSTDISVYGGTVTLDSRTHSLTDPIDVVSSSSDKDTNTTIALITLRTGQYEAEITSGITIAVSSTYWIIDTINGTRTHDVWASDGITDLESGIAALYDRYNTSLATDNGNATEALETVVGQVNAAYSLYQINRFSGDVDQAAVYLNDIVELLAAEDITIIEPTSESIPITRIYPGYATAWYNGSGVPSVDLGRNGDYYFRTDTNQAYFKSSDTWSVIGILGANTIIQFSADGSTGWTTTYANGLNYIRFSGDGGSSWTVASKFIDGYVYYAYASDDSGTDFIATDDPSFTFNPVLEYIALKKFDESHNGDLIASDFTGLFTKYRDNGIIAYSSNPSVSIQTDKDGNNPVFPVTNPEIFIYDGDTDVTSSWTVVIDSTVDITASVINDNEIDITAIAADNGSITINCSRSGYDDLNVLMLVSKTKAGQAVVDATSVDDVTIGINESDKAYVKDNSITTQQISRDNLHFLNFGTPLAISGANNIGLCALDINTIAFYNDTDTTLSTYSIKTGVWTKIGNSLDVSGDISPATPTSGVAMTALTSSAIAFLPSDGSANATSYLSTYSWDGTDWSLAGNKLDILAGIALIAPSMTKLTSTSIVISADFAGSDDIRTYSWDGTDWTLTGNVFSLPNSPGGASVCTLTTTSIAHFDIRNNIQAYSWDGSDWTTLGNSFALGIASTQSCVIAVSSSEIIAFDTFNDLMKDYNFDGTNWTLNGNQGYFLSGDTYPKMDFLSNNIIVIFSDSGDDEITSFLRVKSI